MSDYTRVFTDGGSYAHLLDYLSSPNSPESQSLCGRSPWPGFWHGTGSQDEEDRAYTLETCTPCRVIRDHRTGGYEIR